MISQKLKHVTNDLDTMIILL